MQSSLLTSLPVRVGLSITAIALVLVTAISSVLYHQTFKQEIQDTERSLAQLVVTVGNSAAIASYLDNVEIAKDVVAGLANNDIISGAAISSDTGMYQASGDLQPANMEAPFNTYPLYSPFSETEQVGSITIRPNWLFIEQRARRSAWAHIFSLTLQTLAIVAFVILFVYWQLTRPIMTLAQEIHEIPIGGSKRLKIPRWHHKDEIGQLIINANQRLEASAIVYEKERKQCVKIESLERQFRLIFESTSGGIVLSSPQGNLVLHNPSFEKLIGPKRVEKFLNSETKLLTEIFEDSTKVRDVLEQVSLHQTTVAVDLKLVENEEKENFRWLHCLFSPLKNDDGELLVEIAERLKSGTRNNDLVIRWGGDEFLVVVVEGSRGFDASAPAERILKLFDKGIDLGGGQEGNVGASIGIAICPEHASEKNALIGLADNAMYQIKQGGRNGYAFADGGALPTENKGGSSSK